MIKQKKKRRSAVLSESSSNWSDEERRLSVLGFSGLTHAYFIGLTTTMRNIYNWNKQSSKCIPAKVSRVKGV